MASMRESEINLLKEKVLMIKQATRHARPLMIRCIFHVHIRDLLASLQLRLGIIQGRERCPL